MRAQEAVPPPYNLQSLGVQLPGSRQRALTNDSIDSSPITSPTTSHFSEYVPTPEQMHLPRSVPLGFGDEISTLGNGGGFTHAGIQFPSAWQMTEDQPLLQYPAPTSANGYLSVNDLAHQIFQEPTTMGDQSAYQAAITDTTLGTSHSIDAVLQGSASTRAASEGVSSTGSPRPLYGPKYLYRSNSGTSRVEPSVMTLASEIGISGQLMSQCIQQWFRHLYPIHPILHEPSFMKMLNQQEELSTQDKILVLSLCALTVTHAAPFSDLTLQNKQDLGRELLKQCLHLRLTYEWIETATLTTIIASFFISVTFFELKQVRSHHFYLREAIGLARGMHTDVEVAATDPIEIICQKRMLALMFITERGCAIMRNKPISLMHLPLVPKDFFDGHDELVIAGFTSLCSLFSTLDEKFVQLWYANDDDERDRSPMRNLAAIQHDLNRLQFDDTKMTDIQKADVLITHQWLRLIFWQASMRQGLITTALTDEVFCYNYPIIIARDLCQAMRGMEYDAILVHGLGIFEKVFEVVSELPYDASTL